MRAVKCLAALPSAAVLLLAGCAEAPVVSSERFAATGIARDVSVGVMVLYHERCAEHRERDGRNCAPDAVTRAINGDYAACVEDGLRNGRHRVTVVPGDRLHSAYLAADEPEYRDLTPDRAAVLLTRGDIRERLLSDGIAYVALLSATTVDSNRHTEFVVDPSGGWGVGRTSQRQSTVQVDVIGVESGRRAGSLALSIYGESGWVVPVFIIVPLPPIPYGSRTESRACEAMGDAIAQFLYSQATPFEGATPEEGSPRPAAQDAPGGEALPPP